MKLRRPPVQNDDGTITIRLTKGYIAIIDNVDADLAQLNWHADLHLKWGIVYAARGEYIDGKLFRDILLHRVILSRVLGRELTDGEKVDHKDGKSWNSVRSNLRLATTSQNSQNQKVSVRSRSGLKGTVWLKNEQKWAGRIKVNGKVIHLGTFNDPKDAHEAYRRAALKYFGEFARFE